MTKAYLVHEETGKKYEVVSFNRADNKVQLKGEHATFEETFDKEKFKSLGYRMVKE